MPIPPHNPCPSCQAPGKKVSVKTLVALLDTPSASQVKNIPYRFCRTPDCNTVYYAETSSQQFFQNQLKVDVFQKLEGQPSRLVCYCFTHSQQDLEERGESILESISQKCRNGQDNCETTNPQGSCCLANVRGILKEAGLLSPNRDANNSRGCCDQKP